MQKLLKTFLVAFVFAAVALIAPSAARADTVSFGTAGAFNGAGNTIAFGRGGNFLTVAVTGTGAAITPGTTFTLTINQALPGTGSGDFSASVKQHNRMIEDVIPRSSQVTSVPEPTSLLLLGVGLIGVAGAVRRRLKTPGI